MSSVKSCRSCNASFRTRIKSQAFCSMRCEADYSDEFFDPKARNLDAKMRLAVFARDGFRCVYCGTKELKRHLSVDHVFPAVEGGTTGPFNVVTSCHPCNKTKAGAVLPREKIFELWDSTWDRSLEDPNFFEAFVGWRERLKEKRAPK